MNVRLTTLFRKVNGQWLMRHNHLSFPSNEQDVDEAFPMDALRAQNNKLKLLVAKRTEELEEKSRLLENETRKTERLLYNILPEKVARELIETGQSTPARHDMVSVLFTDFKDFSRISATISAEKLVNELNDLFAGFDSIIKKHGLEKIKTIGDSYMAVCGLPQSDGKHAHKSIKAAKEMLEFIKNRNAERDVEWNMRIGIHSGPVVAGVVGNYKFSYDLWGHTVNLASRMEGAGRINHINISEDTFTLIQDQYNCQFRGEVPIKGDEVVKMYFVS